MARTITREFMVTLYDPKNINYANTLRKGL